MESLKVQVNSSTRLIGLVGPAGMGKTSLARELERIWPHRVNLLSVAEDMKNFLGVLGIHRNHSKFREAAQFLNGLKAILGGGVFIKPVLRDLDGTVRSGDILVFDDIRFVEEIEECRKWFPSVFIRLVRDTYKPVLTGELANHPSETGFDSLNVDFTVDMSTGTLAAARTVEEIVSNFFSKTNAPLPPGVYLGNMGRWHWVVETG